MEENYKTGTGEMDAVLLITEAINATVATLYGGIKAYSFL